MRIAILIGGLNNGGAERQVLNLAKQLRLVGVEPTVVTFRAATDPFLENELVRSGVDYRVVSSGTGGWLVQQVDLYQILSNSDFDIVYTYLQAASLRALFLKLLRRRLVVIVGIRNTRVPAKLYGLRFIVVEYLYRLFLSAADGVIANSAQGCHESRRLRRGKPCLVVPNGIDTDRFQPPTSFSEVQEAKTNCGIPPDKKVVVLIARNDPMKGIPDFIAAATDICARRSDVLFVLSGRGIGEFESSVEVKRNFLFFEHSDSALLLKACDLLVMPSRFGEGFPNVIGEALATGLRIVATNVGEAQTLIGNYGSVVEPYDVAALIKHIEIELDHLPALSNRSEYHQYIKSHYGVEALAVRTLSALHCFVSTRKPNHRPLPGNTDLGT